MSTLMAHKWIECLYPGLMEFIMRLHVSVVITRICCLLCFWDCLLNAVYRISRYIYVHWILNTDYIGANELCTLFAEFYCGPEGTSQHNIFIALHKFWLVKKKILYDYVYIIILHVYIIILHVYINISYGYIIFYTCIHNYLVCIHNYLYMYT